MGFFYGSSRRSFLTSHALKEMPFFLTSCNSNFQFPRFNDLHIKRLKNTFHRQMSNNLGYFPNVLANAFLKRSDARILALVLVFYKHIELQITGAKGSFQNELALPKKMSLETLRKKREVVFTSCGPHGTIITMFQPEEV